MAQKPMIVCKLIFPANYQELIKSTINYHACGEMNM